MIIACTPNHMLLANGNVVVEVNNGRVRVRGEDDTDQTILVKFINARTLAFCDPI